MTSYAPNQTCLTGRLGLFWRRDVWPGLTRWSFRRQVTNAGWRVYVHRFVVLDSDVHDHPWAWCCSGILRGHYTEQYNDVGPDATLFERVVRWVNYIPGCRWHRITGLPADGEPVWTVVGCGPQKGTP